MRAIVPCGVAAHPGIVRAGRGRSGGLGDWTYAPGPAVRGLDPGRKPIASFVVVLGTPVLDSFTGRDHLQMRVFLTFL